MKVFLYPSFEGPDEGDGGIRRVVEAQRQSLPRLGVEFVNELAEADIVACHTVIPHEFVGRLHEKPIVNHTHGLYWQEYEWMDWSYKANRDVLRAVCTADVTTAPTEWVAQVVRRHTSRDVRVIPHGISGRDWQVPAAHRGYVLWNKTRIDPVCEIDSLNALVRRLPDVPFVSTYGREAANMQLTGKLNFTAAKELVRHAGVYLCTTRETFGIGTLEAMASGVPVVGFNFGGQAEFIEHGVDGWLAEPGDIEGLAEGILWALANRDSLSKLAHDKAMVYSWTEAMKAYRDLYSELIERYAKQEEAPRTSIIVTAYNLEAYLPDTLDSVLAQADEDWECIVVDDASPDRCGAIADEYAKKDKRVRVIHNEENQYLAEARNIGIDQAKGRYILPLDADDKLTPHAVRILADALDNDRTLQVAYGNVFFTEEDGKTPVDYHVPNQTPGHSGWPIGFAAWQQVHGANLLPYSSMFRRTAWSQTGGYRSRLKTAEDADFWTRLASFGYNMQMVTTTDTLVYRNRNQSMSRENNDKRYDYMKWFSWSKDAKLAPAGLSGERSVSLLTPHISVIIPVGPGHERHVTDALDSVMAQTYRYWEAIVINDTGKPLRMPSWARVIESDRRDAGASRNLGIAAARGRLFLPLDADDYLQPDALQWLVSAHVETQGSIIYPDFFEDPHTEGQYTVYQFPDFSCDQVMAKRMVRSVVALTPIAAWKAVGGYAENHPWEDWDFELRLNAAGWCQTRIAAPLFTYRKWTGFRRHYDQAELERRKAIIWDTWGEHFQGRKQFMGCSCNKRTVTPSSARSQSQSLQFSGKTYSEAQMVEYVGRRMGKVRYKGVGTGSVYAFMSGQGPMWVAAPDVAMFASHSEFIVHEKGTEVKDANVPVLAV